MRLLLLAVIVGCWALVTPPNGGPDETAHFTRGAAVLRGDPSGVYTGLDSSLRYFDVPSWVGWPDPVCYAFKPDVGADCLSDVPLPPEGSKVAARGYAYPVWSHVVAGVGSLIGSPRAALYWGRIFDAILPVVLVGWTLTEAARRGREALAALMIALTPMAIFTMAVVNPSGLAIAGGLAFFAAWIWSVDEPARPQLRWLGVAGWVALVLPRRDGLIWGCLGIAAWAVVFGEPLRARARWLGRWGMAICVSSIALMGIWALGSASRVTRSLVVVPVVIPAAVLARAFVRRAWRAGTGRRVLLLAGAAAALVLAWSILMLQPSGASWDQVRHDIESTGSNLREAIGVLGWLDTPLPELGHALWGVSLGMLVVIGVIATPRVRLVYGVVMATVAILVSWFLELYGDVATGTYWQGRYWLPVLPAVTVALGAVEWQRRDRSSVVASIIIWASMLLLNVALWAAVRRWGVGVNGSLRPGDWDTYGAPVGVVPLLVVHALASAWLAWSLTRERVTTPAISPVDAIDDTDLTTGTGPEVR